MKGLLISVLSVTLLFGTMSSSVLISAPPTHPIGPIIAGVAKVVKSIADNRGCVATCYSYVHDGPGTTLFCDNPCVKVRGDADSGSKSKCRICDDD